MGLGRDWFDYKCCGTPPTAFNGNECTDHIRRDTWRDANANSRTHTWRIVFNATAFCFVAAGYTRYLESLGWHAIPKTPGNGYNQQPQSKTLWH